MNFKARYLDADVPPPPPGLATDPVGAPLAPPGDPLPWLSTRGNQIVDPSGRPVRLRGVDMSGFEYNKAGDQQNPHTPVFCSDLLQSSLSLSSRERSHLAACRPIHASAAEACLEIFWSATSCMPQLSTKGILFPVPGNSGFSCFF